MKSDKEKIILNYLRRNPNATTRDIRRDTKIHVERVFSSIKNV